MSNTPIVERIIKSINGGQANSSAGTVSEFTSGNIEMLWLQVLANDIDAYEVIHRLFYPMLFRYGKFITSDIKFVDDVVKEVFIQCWINRDGIDGKKLPIEMVQAMRQEFLIRSAANIPETQDQLEKEIRFLNKVLKIEWDGVLQIMDIESCAFFN